VYAFVVLDLVSSVLCQEIGSQECLRNDLFSVKRDVKPESIRFACLFPITKPFGTNGRGFCQPDDLHVCQLTLLNARTSNFVVLLVH